MKKSKLIIICLLLGTILNYSCKKDETPSEPIIVDHTCINISDIPVEWINKAKQELHIAYGRSSYGTQLITGMTGLENWKGEPYLWNNGELEGSLDIRDGIMGGDLGGEGDVVWAETTHSYLGDWRNENINVVIWAWENGVSNNTEAGINSYLNEMAKLEAEFPNVKFVYMTGHLDGTGESGNLHLRNEQIRKFCRDNNKILYDFAHIESYNPDGTYFLNKSADAACNYDSDNDEISDSNWALEWQSLHTEDVDWYDCVAENSQAVNANMKAYAAWWLWARLAGWSGI